MDDALPMADVEEVKVSDADIKRVRDAAELALSLDEDVARLTGQLASKQEALKEALERTLPNAMIAARLETWPLPGGARFDLHGIVAASIPKAFTEEAHGWLEEKGHGDLIKHRFTILFGRDDFKWAKKFAQDLARRKRPLVVERKDWVEPQTLGAFVREQVKLAAAEGRDPAEAVPANYFGVFRATVARLVKPKEKRS